MTRRLLAVLALPVLLLTAPSVRAQADCGTWQSTFAAPGTDDQILDWAVYDDGSGPALYAAGAFTSIGAQPIQGVARWNGTSWSPVGNSPRFVTSIEVYDDGSGSELYAGGSLSHIFVGVDTGVARWNGTIWHLVPGIDTASTFAMQVFDDGTGPALFLAGAFHLTGITPFQHVVRWDGTGVVTPTGSGLPGASHRALAVYDDGSGARLYTGNNSTTGGVYVWNGTGWTPTTPALPGARINALATYTDASGTALYAAGRFDSIGGTTYHGIARYDGTAWSPLGSGVTGGFTTIHALVVHDEGTGPRLVAGGVFTHAGGIPAEGVASWDGTTWRPIDPGLSLNYARSLASFDDGSGPGLYVGGEFQRAGRVAAARAAVWRAGAWHRIAAGEGLGGTVECLLRFDDGTGPVLYAGGEFQTAGTTLAQSIARWDGQAWSALGAPMDTDGEVHALGAYDSGSGSRLYAGGDFTRIGGASADGIASWNGTSWTPLGLGIQPGQINVVDTMVVFDSGAGPELVVGGTFSMAGGVPAANIARWNGSSWSALGSGTNNRVRDLIVHDDGTGPALYACGWFNNAGGVSVPYVARWNGTAWSAVGSSAQYSGFNQMNDLEVYDDGFGPKLFMSGLADFGNGLASVVIWDGAGWFALGALPSGFAEALTVFHDGQWPKLHAAFRDYNSSPTRTAIHAWDGFQWSAPVGTVTGTTGNVTSFGVLDAEADGVPDLYVGGGFRDMNGVSSANLALFRSCGTVGTVQCAGDGTGHNCPCNNHGASGHGCANSNFAGGAALTNVGLASIGSDTLELVAEGLTGTSALFFQGTAPFGGGNGIVFDDGLLCAGGATQRLRTVSVIGGSARLPQAGGPSLSVLGQILAPSEIRTYQVRYRNAASFCTPGTTNFTNGLRIVWSL